MSRIFVRNIPAKLRQSDLENIFSKHGKIADIILKPNFAFIEYNSDKEANEAVKHLNDYNIQGAKLCVELAKTRSEKMAERLNEKCFKCGGLGHWAKDCKISRHERREKRNKFLKTRKSPKRSFSRSFTDSSRSRSRSR